MTLALWLVKLSAWLVPADQRADWRREWIAELHARPAGLGALRFAAGAPVHALWLCLEPWWPEIVMSDVRSSWRFLRRRPGFVLPVVITLALGIGATIAGFSVVYSVLLKPLPYRDPARLVQLWETNPRFNWTEATIAPGNYLSWRERQTTFSEMAWYYGTAARHAMLNDLTLDGETPVRARVQSVSANFFAVLGVGAGLGRTFVEGEDELGRHRVAILADAFWRRQFGADPNVLGRTLVLNGVSFNVIGVMAPEFRFDTPDTEFWIPAVMNWQEMREVRRPHFLRAVARLKPGVEMAQARAELSKIAADLEREYPNTNTQMGAGLGPLDDWFVGPSRRPLLLLFAGMAVILVSACANVANLMLARTRDRLREMSLRAALGANRLRLTRQIFLETLMVAGVGTALGLGLAAAGIQVLLGAAPAGVPRQDEIAFDPMVWLFAAAVGVTTAVMVGLLPALRATRGDLRAVLTDGARSTSVESRRLHRSFVAVQIALAAVLLGSAALTLRSVHALTAVDPGFPMDGLVTARISLGTAKYRPTSRATAFFDELRRRLREVTGVTGAGAGAVLPLEGASWSSQFFIEADPTFRGTELRHKSVTPGYLEATGHRLLAGRMIEAGDRADTTLVSVINESMRRAYFANVNPIGQRYALDPPTPNVRWRTIVGVVNDERQDGLGVPVRPEVFDSAFQEGFSSMAIAVRSTLPPDQAVAEIRRAVRDLDPQVAVFDAGPFADRLHRSTLRERIAAWLVGVFAAIGLALSGVGTYSIAARAVAARTREIGVRVACGATAADVFRMILRDHMRVAIVGLAVGIPLVVIASRALGTVLYGVEPMDPVSLAAGITVPLLVAVAASMLPARRALRVDPVTALKAEG